MISFDMRGFATSAGARRALGQVPVAGFRALPFRGTYERRRSVPPFRDTIRAFSNWLPCHYKRTTGNKSLHTAFLPFFRKCGKQLYGTVVTLQQHLRHTSCESEITIDLEWRMSVKEIAIGAAVGIVFRHSIAREKTEHVADDAEGMVAV